MNQRANLGYRQAFVSIVGNILLFGLKYYAGFITGSIALIADAWHTLSDSLSSIILFLGFKISAKPADSKHPYGHGRAELIASVIIGTLLAMIALNFLTESIHRLIDRTAVTYGSFAIIVTIISIVTKEAMAQYAFWCSRKTTSELLRADGWHHRSDAISSVLILIGIFLGRFFWWIDSAMGIMLAGILFYVTWDILRSSTSHLLGECPSEHEIKQIIALARQCCRDELHLHHFHLHTYGQHREVTFHIQLPGTMRLDAAHAISTALEDKIRETLNLEPTIHIDPTSSTS
jgi:cation diffusion facilitator family transporter